MRHCTIERREVWLDFLANRMGNTVGPTVDPGWRLLVAHSTMAYGKGTHCRQPDACEKPDKTR